MSCAPLKIPHYDLFTAQAASFLVNVASQMGKQWLAQVDPEDPTAFDWTPEYCCAVPSSSHPVPKLDDFEIDPSQLLWTTFSYDARPTLCQGLPADWMSSPATEPFGFLARRTSDGAYFLAFRGTQTRPDCAIDLATCMTALPGTKPHVLVQEGFLALVQGMNTLGSVLQSVPASSRLTVTGHSQGSAVATLVVALAAGLGLDSTVALQNYNSASPKVGNQNFVDHYNDLRFAGLPVPTYRLVNTVDVVPKNPTRSCQGTLAKKGECYVHLGVPVEFTADYGSEGKNHDPCCSYGYAIFNPDDPCNPDYASCAASDS